MNLENSSIPRLNVSKIRSNLSTLFVNSIYITDDFGSILTDDSGQKITS